MEQQEWNALAESWQAQHIDVPALQRSTRKKTRMMRLTVAGEVFSVLLVWAFSGYFLIRYHPPLIWQIWVAFWAVVQLLVFIYAGRLRRDAWRSPDESVQELLALKKRRALAGIRLSTLCISFCAVCLVLTWGWVFVTRLIHSAPQASLVSATIVTGWILLWWIGSIFYKRKQRRLMAEVDSMESELKELV